MFKGIVLFLAGAVDVVRRLLGMQERAQAKEEGRTEVRAERLADAVETKDRQLEIASAPDETREELLGKARKRKRAETNPGS